MRKAMNDLITLLRYSTEATLKIPVELFEMDTKNLHEDHFIFDILSAMDGLEEDDGLEISMADVGEDRIIKVKVIQK